MDIQARKQMELKSGFEDYYKCNVRFIDKKGITHWCKNRKLYNCKGLCNVHYKQREKGLQKYYEIIRNNPEYTGFI